VIFLFKISGERDFVQDFGAKKLTGLFIFEGMKSILKQTKKSPQSSPIIFSAFFLNKN